MILVMCAFILLIIKSQYKKVKRLAEKIRVIMILYYWHVKGFKVFVLNLILYNINVYKTLTKKKTKYYIVFMFVKKSSYALKCCEEREKRSEYEIFYPN